MNHLQDNIEKYKELFKDFIDTNEWNDIVEECDPQFCPKDGEPLGLRNIHVFGLANVLRRPIILLDSVDGMQSSGDYSGKYYMACFDWLINIKLTNHIGKFCRIKIFDRQTFQKNSSGRWDRLY
jgi:hypothetical protein